MGLDRIHTARQTPGLALAPPTSSPSGADYLSAVSSNGTAHRTRLWRALKLLFEGLGLAEVRAALDGGLSTFLLLRYLYFTPQTVEYGKIVIGRFRKHLRTTMAIGRVTKSNLAPPNERPDRPELGR